MKNNPTAEKIMALLRYALPSFPKGIQRFGPVCEFPFPCPEGMVREDGICSCPHWEHQLADGTCVKDLEPLPSP
jgi:hypothetical protein